MLFSKLSPVICILTIVLKISEAIKPSTVSRDSVSKSRPTFGWNDWDCKPSAAHPYPLILVHGLGCNDREAWHYMAPRFVSKGYCVYSFTYGTIGGLQLIGAVGPIERSAAELNRFVKRVQKATGSSKVDLVGHSEGAVVSQYLLKRLNGGSLVHKFASVGGAFNGSNLLGLTDLIKATGTFGLVATAVNPVCTACTQLVKGSLFLKNLKAGDDIVPGVGYLFVVSRSDEIVVPFTDGLLKGHGHHVVNIVLQDDWCAKDVIVLHSMLILDPVVFNGVHAFLTPAVPQKVTCRGLSK